MTEIKDLNKLTLQIYVHNKWTDCATITMPTNGGSPIQPLWFEPDMLYAINHISPQLPHEKPTLLSSLEIGQDKYCDQWPSFLMDLVPNGYNRTHWLNKLELKGDGPHYDWTLLTVGAANSPGNLRIKESVNPNVSELISGVSDQGPIQNIHHPGFSEKEIAEKGEEFIEYATANNAWASGGSDVQGQAAKFLAVRDQNEKFHVIGGIPDNDVTDYWIVKFPRGKTERDHLVLQMENRYLEVARSFGLNCDQPTRFIEPGALFIPRFDRIKEGNKLHIYGMESLYSLCSVNQFGKAISHEQALLTIRNLPLPNSTAFQASDYIEYIRRDLLNIVMGNTDNHGRNTQIIKKTDGTIALSPLFDFAPMYLDPEGIARSMRWQGDLEYAGRPQWKNIVDWCEQHLQLFELKEALVADIPWLANIGNTLNKLMLDEIIIDRAMKSARAQILQLENL